LAVGDRVVGFRLGDAEEKHAASPRTFFIPQRAERESLARGDLARLLFELVDPGDGDPAAERMWVEVVETRGGRYVGVLTNAPAAITTIERGGLVEFGPEHVISTLDDWSLLEKKIFVSRRSHEQDLRPGYVYREPPDNDRDSGWRALVGDESHEEVDDPGNVLLQAVGFLLDRWPELRAVLETDPRNGSWAWDAQAERYVPVVDAEQD
jgi:hypothetical protein